MCPPTGCSQSAQCTRFPALASPRVCPCWPFLRFPGPLTENRRSPSHNKLFSGAYRRLSFPHFSNPLPANQLPKSPRAASVAAIWLVRTFRASAAHLPRASVLECADMSALSSDATRRIEPPKPTHATPHFRASAFPAAVSVEPTAAMPTCPPRSSNRRNLSFILRFGFWNFSVSWILRSWSFATSSSFISSLFFTPEFCPRG